MANLLIYLSFPKYSGMIKRLFRMFEESRRFVLFLVIVNILGTLVGVYYYWNQLSSSPVYQWVFIADCPIYTLLFAIAVGFRLRRIYLLAFFGVVKYASWTLFVLTLFPEYYFSIDSSYYSILYILHILMLLEGFLLVPSIKKDLLNSITVTAWFLLNDFADYFFGTVSTIPPYGFNTIMLFSFASTLILGVLINFISLK